MSFLNKIKNSIGLGARKSKKDAQRVEKLRDALANKERKSEKVLTDDKSEKHIPQAKASSGTAYKIIVAPHITEKTTEDNANNKYTFKVFPKANKIEVKKAIQSLYDVKVESVRIINTPAKSRRRGNKYGYKSGYKKATVFLKEGHKIDLLPH
ncbi:MAG: 50S ribosomal protein L23 [Parcubacteria group bacterium GW2011_GWA2_39_18]|nr:MAG: 50S ribosomal protein L23 [Parcubacteria group bacterium GW2011_GWA2_39_18]